MAGETNSNSPSITHVIFDLDGLLIETESLYTKVTQGIVDRFGKTFDWSLKSSIMGRPPLVGAEIVVQTLELPLAPQEFLRELHDELDKLFPDSQLMPGGEKLIRHLHSHGVPMAVATGSAKVQYDLKVHKKSDLFDCMSHAVCSDDPEVKSGKPAPDVYLASARRFADPPKSMGSVLVFEDAPSGVQAAKRAGMVCVMVPDKRIDREKTREADSVLESLSDIDLTKYGLPAL